MSKSRGLVQAYNVQDFAYEQIVSLREQMQAKPDVRSTIAMTRLIAAWSSAQERIAFHRRVPSPGSLRPEARKTKRPRRAARLTATVAPAPATIPVDKPPTT